MSMKGTTRMTISHDTMCEIVQQWITRSFNASVGKQEVVKVEQPGIADFVIEMSSGERVPVNDPEDS